MDTRIHDNGHNGQPVADRTLGNAGPAYIPRQLRRVVNDPHPACVRIRQLRRAMGMSAATLADLVGINRTTLISYELGTRQPTARQLDAILAILGHRLGVEPIPIGADGTDTSSALAMRLRIIAAELDGGEVSAA